MGIVLLKTEKKTVNGHWDQEKSGHGSKQMDSEIFTSKLRGREKIG